MCVLRSTRLLSGKGLCATRLIPEDLRTLDRLPARLSRLASLLCIMMTQTRLVSDMLICVLVRTTSIYQGPCLFETPLINTLRGAGGAAQAALGASQSITQCSFSKANLSPSLWVFASTASLDRECLQLCTETKRHTCFRSLPLDDHT